jgi:hypothetical protein
MRPVSRFPHWSRNTDIFCLDLGLYLDNEALLHEVVCLEERWRASSTQLMM